MPQKEKGSANNYSWARSVLKSQNIKKSTVKDQLKSIPMLRWLQSEAQLLRKPVLLTAIHR